MKYAFMAQQHGTWPVAVLCEVCDMSRSGFSSYVQRQAAPTIERDKVALLARVQALIRRAGGLSEPTQLVVGNLAMNLLSREVVREGRRIELQPIEFSLLEYLLRNTGRVVSKTMIMEHVWDYNFDPQTNVVEARISRLRDKIDRDFSQKLIHTIRGVGYVLRENP